MQDCIHKALCPGLGFLHGMSTSSDTPSHTVLLLSSTATEFALCLLDSEKWQNWEMSCPPPKANLIVWQQMICNYLWEVLHFMPIASLTQILPKGRILDLIWHYTFLKKIMFSRREISLLISPFLSSPLLFPFHWRKLLIPISDKFQEAGSMDTPVPKPKRAPKTCVSLKNWGLASCGVKDRARDNELACPDDLFDLVSSTLTSCWVHFHYLHLSSYLLTWCVLHRKESSWNEMW